MAATTSPEAERLLGVRDRCEWPSSDSFSSACAWWLLGVWRPLPFEVPLNCCERSACPCCGCAGAKDLNGGWLSCMGGSRAGEVGRLLARLPLRELSSAFSC